MGSQRRAKARQLSQRSELGRREVFIDPIRRPRKSWLDAYDLGALGENYGAVLAEGRRTTEAISPDTDHGTNRSSAHWDRQANLLTTSILLRLLATLEAFETDALKGLFYYRPTGSGTPVTEFEEEEVDENVIFEEPVRKQQVDHFKLPPLWTWIKRSAEDNTQRRAIYSRVYGITFTQPDFGKKLSDLYEMRNAIAHGRKRVDVSIGLIFNVDAYVANSMIHLRDQNYENYRLII